jgi:hypothetical protein
MHTHARTQMLHSRWTAIVTKELGFKSLQEMQAHRLAEDFWAGLPAYVQDQRDLR